MTDDATNKPAKPAQAPRTLSETDIVTKRHLGRRAFLGVMAAGAVGTALVPTQAAASDSDNGAWEDAGSCPRGFGTGVSDSDVGGNSDPAGWGYSGQTDQDGGNIADKGGHGRGAPYC